MSTRPILTWPDVRLTQPCAEVGEGTAVTRPAAVRLAYTGLDGARHVRDLTGFDAVCAQHEYDHLDGVLTFDRLDADARAALLADYDEAAT